MFRPINFSLLFLACALTMSATQIQLTGTATNVAGYGLSSTYVQTNGCAGAQLNSATCATSSTTGVPGNYLVSLFADASGITPPDAAGQKASGFTGLAGTPIVFDMLNAPLSAPWYVGNTVTPGQVDSNFIKSGTKASQSTATIAVGLNEISSVYTMLNDFAGYNNGDNITVSFCFSATSNGTCTSDQLTSVTLKSGVEVRAAVICDSTQGATGCPTSGTYGQTLAASSTVNGVTVNTANVYSQTYTSIPSTLPDNSANGPWAGSAGGKVVLDAQQFVFTPTTSFLSYIQVVDNVTNFTPAPANPGSSHFALSAVTVEQTPEPASFGLLFAGMTAVGFLRLRRRS